MRNPRFESSLHRYPAFIEKEATQPFPRFYFCLPSKLQKLQKEFTILFNFYYKGDGLSLH